MTGRAGTQRNRGPAATWKDGIPRSIPRLAAVTGTGARLSVQSRGVDVRVVGRLQRVDSRGELPELVGVPQTDTERPEGRGSGQQVNEDLHGFGHPVHYRTSAIVHARRRSIAGETDRLRGNRVRPDSMSGRMRWVGVTTSLAFTRSPHKLERSAGLRIAQGDVTDAASVAAAVAGHDAVIVALGSNGLRDRTTLTTGTRTIVDGMTRHAVERLVILSAAGVGESWRQVPLLARVLFRTLLRNIHADHTAQEALVRTSSMDWTIVRAAILTDDPASGNVTATNTGEDGAHRAR